MNIGIIGGSGLEKSDILSQVKEIIIDTDLGKVPGLSAKFKTIDLTIILRHGVKHNITPSDVNYRANIAALHECKCDFIIATSACGSLREEFAPGDIVIIDQFIDWTKGRKNTFYSKFEDNNPKHVPMGDPFDSKLREKLIICAQNNKIKCHTHGTMISIEGPRFSTRAESKMFKSFGADLINMTIATEAPLAKELDIPYAVIALVTDYDSWREGTQVTWAQIESTFKQNVSKATKILISLVEMLENEI